MRMCAPPRFHLREPFSLFFHSLSPLFGNLSSKYVYAESSFLCKNRLATTRSPNKFSCFLIRCTWCFRCAPRHARGTRGGGALGAPGAPGAAGLLGAPGGGNIRQGCLAKRTLGGQNTVRVKDLFTAIGTIYRRLCYFGWSETHRSFLS